MSNTADSTNPSDPVAPVTPAEAQAPVPTPAPIPVPPAPAGSTPGDFDMAQLETIKNSEKLARSAKKSEYNTALITEGMLSGTPDALVTACALWRSLSSQALDATNEGEESTGRGVSAETLLRHEVEYYRGKVRIAITQHPEWTKVEKDALKARYFVNKDIFANEDLTGQTVETLLGHAAEDNLPGVTPARLASSNTILGTFTNKPGEQTDAQTEATKNRGLRDAAFDEVMRLRQQIQLAANDAWPWWLAASIAPRGEFLIPIGRAFTA